MKRSGRHAAVLLLLALSLPAWAGGVADKGAVEGVVISGHRGAVLAIDHDDARNLIFTAGADGTVRVWDAPTRALLKSLTVTSLRAAMLAVSPDASRLAVLCTDALQSFSLEVWDWQKGQRLWKAPLGDQPLFLRYSASGKYLLYSLPRWESLRIVNAADGSPVAFHPEGFGIVGFAALSRSEKILMTYRMTGDISYWDLASGKSVESLPGVPLLSHIRLSPDLSFIAGSTDSEVCLVDVATGSVRARAPLSGVTSLDISPKGDQIACITGDGALSRWSIQQGSLTPMTDLPGVPRASIARFASGSIIIGFAAGGLGSLAASGQMVSFTGDTRAVVTGLAVRGDAVALATSSWIKVFTSGLPDAARGEADGSQPVESFQVDNPFPGSVDLTFLDDGSLLAWESANGPGSYAILDVKQKSLHAVGDPLPTPVTEALVDGKRCLLLSEDGTLRIIDARNGAARVQISRPGAMWASPAGGNTIAVGGQPGDVEPGSLVRINMDTGETDPIPTRNRYTYSVMYDAATGALYSLGVDADGTTNLLAHSGADYQNQTLVDGSPGEHLSASLCLDGATGTLYSSLGREKISRWRQGSLEKLPVSATGTVGLASASGILYSLNRDSSVSFIDAASGRSLADLSVFNDGGWALLLADGRFAASSGSESRVSILSDGVPVQNTGDYLVPVRVAQEH